jgi:serine protease AprX
VLSGNHRGCRLALLLVIVVGAVGWLASGEIAHAGSVAPHWVFFRDKGIAPARLPAALSARLAELAPRARARRQRVRGDLGVDLRDLRIAPRYLEAVRATGVRVRVRSGWLNAVSVEGDAGQLEAISGLPFVASVRPVGRHPRRRDPPPVSSQVFCQPMSDPYGVARAQLEQINIPALHACGLTGAGVVVGVLDTGFTLQHNAFAGLQVVAQRDFINDDDNTEDEAGDPPFQHEHGTMVLSALAGREAGSYSGAAPDVKVILAKVDSLPDDKPIEDDWFVAGLQWAEGLGADLVTTSLGFCTPPCLPSQKDGETEATSKASGIAVANGLIMLAAAGNYGPQPTSISAPGDAKGVITVGSVDLSGVVDDASSRGPTHDGRIKPDVVAAGVDAWVVDALSNVNYRQVSGTSIATPLVAGVAAMLLQAYPTTDPAEMHQLLTSTASGAGNPDNSYGWGIVDGLKAAGLHCSCKDIDGDGYLSSDCGGDDCDDADKEVHPGATERCNGVDDDCDGELAPDEVDADGDTFRACDDCDDSNGSVHPAALEVCDDGIDNDCDGETDGTDAACATPPEPGGGCELVWPGRDGWAVGVLLSLLLWAGVSRRRRRH